MSDLNKIQHPKRHIHNEPTNADYVCWTHCSGVVMQITQDEFAQFALGQVLALGIAAFLVAVIAMIIGFSAHAAQQATTAAPTGQYRDSIAGEFATPLAGRDRPDAATGADLIRKRLDLIKQVVPGVARVAVLWQPGADSEGPMTALQDVGKAAWALDCTFDSCGATMFRSLKSFLRHQHRRRGRRFGAVGPNAAFATRVHRANGREDRITCDL